MRTPRQALAATIARWEGRPNAKSPKNPTGYWQADPADSGNWLKLGDGTKRLIGTHYGVTPGAWCGYKRIAPEAMTREIMLAITLDDAAALGVDRYFLPPGYARLPFGPVVDVAADIGWGSGPARGVKILQLCCGTKVDAAIGQQTVAAYLAWLKAMGHEKALYAMHAARVAWYRECARHGDNAKFLAGWINRADWQSPKGLGPELDWWRGWQPLPGLEVVMAEAPPAPAELKPVPDQDLRRPWYAEMIDKLGEEVADELAGEALHAVLKSIPGYGPAVSMALKAVEALFR